MDDGADVIGVLHSARREQLGDIIAGTEETTTGVIRLKALEARREARLPDHRRQRGADEAPLRQPVRHGPVDDRRDHPRDERAARRQEVRRRRLRLGRARRRVARARARLARDRHRGRPDARARGGHGRLRRDDDGEGRADRRPLLHRDGRQARDRASAHREDAGRRDPLEHGSLQRRDRHPGAARPRSRDADGARVRRGVHDGGRPADLPDRRRTARQPVAPPRGTRRS